MITATCFTWPYFFKICTWLPLLNKKRDFLRIAKINSQQKKKTKKNTMSQSQKLLPAKRRQKIAIPQK